MNEQNKEPEFDVEGHKAGLEGDDLAEDVEGHRIKGGLTTRRTSRATGSGLRLDDDEDVEGHRVKRINPRETTTTSRATA